MEKERILEQKLVLTEQLRLSCTFLKEKYTIGRKKGRTNCYDFNLFVIGEPGKQPGNSEWVQTR